MGALYRFCILMTKLYGYDRNDNGIMLKNFYTDIFNMHLHRTYLVPQTGKLYSLICMLLSKFNESITEMIDKMFSFTKYFTFKKIISNQNTPPPPPLNINWLLLDHCVKVLEWCFFIATPFMRWKALKAVICLFFWLHKYPFSGVWVVLLFFFSSWIN